MQSLQKQSSSLGKEKLASMDLDGNVVQVLLRFLAFLVKSPHHLTKIYSEIKEFERLILLCKVYKENLDLFHIENLIIENICNVFCDYFL